MLDDRKAHILRAVVEEYIETAQPVGSGHVAKAPGVNVSPATVRNDMALLEEEGFLVQPHTSAGRIPTEKGYRFFVDTLVGPGRLGASETQQIRSFFGKAHGELEQMLADTSRLLSGLTRYAAVVVGPPHEAATIRSIQLVELAPRVALLVVVLSNGVVEKHTVELGETADPVVVSAAAAELSDSLLGQVLADAASVLEARVARLRDERATGVIPVLEAVRRLVKVPAKDEPVFIGGTSEMVAAFDAVGTVSEILRVLEQQLVVVSLLHDVIDRGLNVAIGTETGIEPLADCALVVAPYDVDGETAGSIGVLGPSRMNYPQALAAVAVVGRRLGRELSEGG